MANLGLAVQTNLRCGSLHAFHRCTMVERMHGLLCISPGLSPDVDLFELQCISDRSPQVPESLWQRQRHAIMEHTGAHGAEMSCACLRVLLCIF